MRNLLYFLFALLVAGCTCSASPDGELDEAQRLMEEHPEMAFERLNAMDVSAFNDSATLAHWALLYSEALAARHLQAPTDTIVNIALRYYARHGDARQRARALAAKRAALTAGDGGNELTRALYLQKEKEYFLYRERTRREMLALLAGAAILLAGGIIVWLRARLKAQEARHRALLAEASGLRSQVVQGNTTVGRLEETLRDLLGRRFELIDSLCDTYYESQGTKAEHKAIVRRVKQEIEALKGDDAMLRDMEKAVDDCRDGLLRHLREEYADIKPTDYRLAVLLACGLSNRTISLLMGETLEVVYKRKSRLKLRVRALDLPHDADFAAIF